VKNEYSLKHFKKDEAEHTLILCCYTLKVWSQISNWNGLWWSLHEAYNLWGQPGLGQFCV